MNLQYAIELVSLLVMIFVTSKELVSATTEYISNSVLSALNDWAFDNEYLKVLIAFLL